MSKFRTGDRVRTLNLHPVDPAWQGLEGTIVAWVPHDTVVLNRPSSPQRPPQPGDFYIYFDHPPPDPYGRSTKHKAHHGGPFHSGLVELLPREPTIQEIADAFGVDPYDVARAALEE